MTRTNVATATATAYRIHSVPAEVLDRVRATGLDTSGNPVARIVADGGNPLRCCLRDADPGEELILFGYEPPLPAGSPYREIGAVLAHADAEACAGPADLTRYPSDWIGRAQVLRAYDERGWIHEATARHDGSNPQQAIAAMLAEPGVVQIHSRNIDYGCYMFTITPADKN